MSQPLSESVFVFLDELRAAGFSIGVDEYLEAQEIVGALGGDDADPIRLRNWMAAVFCGRAEEQREFYRRFEGWWARHRPRPVERPVLEGPGPGFARPVSETVRAVEESRRSWLGTAAAAVVTLMVGVGIYTSSRHVDEAAEGGVAGGEIATVAVPVPVPVADTGSTATGGYTDSLPALPDPRDGTVTTVSQAEVRVETVVVDRDGTPIAAAQVGLGGPTAYAAVGWSDVALVTVGPGGTVLTAQADGSVSTWGSGSGLVTHWDPREAVDPDLGAATLLGVGTAPTGDILAAFASEQGLKLWWVRSQTLGYHEPTLTNASAVAFSEGGRIAVLSDNGSVTAYDPLARGYDEETGSRSWNLGVGIQHSRARGVRFVSDSSLITVGGPDLPEVALWAGLGSGGVGAPARSVRTIDLPSPPADLAVSPDGQWLALVSAGSDAATVLSLETGEHVVAIPLDGAEATAITFAEGGRVLAIGTAEGSLHLHRPRGELLRIEAHGAPIVEVRALQEGRVASLAAYGPARIWDLSGLAPGASGAEGEGMDATRPADLPREALGSGVSALTVPASHFAAGVVELNMTAPGYERASIPIDLAVLDSAASGSQARGGTLRLRAELLPALPAWRRRLQTYAVESRLLVFFVPLILALCWAGWRRSRRNLVVERRTERGALDEAGIELARPAAELYASAAFARARIDARRYRSAGTGDLDAEATVDAAVRGGGPARPIHKRRLQLPTYLALVDRSSGGDQAAAGADEFLDRLAGGGVPVVRYDFNGDPRMCAPPRGTGRNRSLQEMASRYGGLRLLVFGDGGRLLDPVTGRASGWTARLEAWRERALLTPVSVDEWSVRESELARTGLSVLPATAEGLRAFVGGIERLGAEWDHGARWRPPYPRLLAATPGRWLDRSPPDPDELETLLAQLRAYLGPDGFRWLSALAVYPEQSWYLTLQLGMGLKDGAGRPVLEESMLLRLTRLPWLRRGGMPDWLRGPLIAGMDPEDSETVRAGLADLLASATEASGGPVHLRLARGPDPERRRGLIRHALDVLRAEPEDAELNDYVFVSFMGGRSPRTLQTSAPTRWRRFVYERGLAALGLRSAAVVALVGVTFGLVALLGPWSRPLLADEPVTVSEWVPDEQESPAQLPVIGPPTSRQ